VTAAWVASGVRARAMSRRRLGRAGASELAASASLDDAVTTLARSTYGHDVRPGQGLAEAQRGVVATAVWNLRVLAGWAPRAGVTVLRVLAAAVEIANVLDLVAGVAGGPAPAPYRLGGLTTAWERVRDATSPTEVREALSTSPWGDPGAETHRAISLHLRAELADRVVAGVPEAAEWAMASTVLLVARERIAGGRELPPGAHAAVARVLGPASLEARDLPELARSAPTTGRWALAGIEDPADLWRAEVRWWGRLERDGTAMTRRAVAGRPTIVGAAALLAVDAWRVRAALELAARGTGPTEVLDAVA
jgi:hypothetical protein